MSELKTLCQFVVYSLQQAKQLLKLAEESLSHPLDDSDIGSIIKQIDLDVNRTMPGHKLFSEGAEGVRLA